MRKLLLMKKTKPRRTFFYIIVDGLLIALALYLSFHLRFDGNIKARYLDEFWKYLLVFLTVKYSVFAFCRLYRMTWSYVGFYELLDILKANLISLFILMGIIFMLWHQSLFNGFPRSIPLIDFTISLFFIVIFRTSRRFYLQARSNMNHINAKRTLIIGAGNAGEQIVRDM